MENTHTLYKKKSINIISTVLTHLQWCKYRSPAVPWASCWNPCRLILHKPAKAKNNPSVAATAGVKLKTNQHVVQRWRSPVHLCSADSVSDLHNSVLQASSNEQLISLHVEDEVGSDWPREILEFTWKAQFVIFNLFYFHLSHLLLRAYFVSCACYSLPYYLLSFSYCSTEVTETFSI